VQAPQLNVSYRKTYSSFITTKVQMNMCCHSLCITTINSDDILAQKVSHKNYFPIKKSV